MKECATEKTAKVWCVEFQQFRYIADCAANCPSNDHCNTYQNYIEPRQA